MMNYESIRVAVAFEMPERHRLLLLTWSDSWKAFTLPMTKLLTQPVPESPEHAAVRAAAEVLKLPTRVIPERKAVTMRYLQLSGRDGVIKNYQYTVVRVESHPDFSTYTSHGRSAIWFPVDKLAKGEYQPLSSSVKPVLNACEEWGWV